MAEPHRTIERHVNFYGEYTFLDLGAIVDLVQMIDWPDALAAASPHNID